MRAKLFLILRNRVLSRVVFVILFLHVLFTTNDFTVLLLLLLLNYLLTLEDSAKKNRKIQTWQEFKQSIDWPFVAFYSSYYFGFLVVFFRRLYQIMKPLIINAQAIKSNVHNSKFCCCATFFIPAAAFSG